MTDSRTKNLNVRCAQEEIDAMTRAAKRRGLSVSAWVRMTLLDATGKERS